MLKAVLDSFVKANLMKILRKLLNIIKFYFAKCRNSRTDWCSPSLVNVFSQLTQKNIFRNLTVMSRSCVNTTPELFHYFPLKINPCPILVPRAYDLFGQRRDRQDKQTKPRRSGGENTLAQKTWRGEFACSLELFQCYCSQD